MARVKGRLDRRSFRRAAALAGTESPRILDVGGGSGEISAALVRASGGRASATVVDIDERSSEAARERGLEAVTARFEEFESESRYDIVLMLNLIEHVADPTAILVKARELLTGHGVLWLQTPNYRSLDARLFRHRNWTGYHCPRHWTIFSEAGLRKALARCELPVLRFERTQGGSFWAGSLLGLRRARDPIGAQERRGPIPEYRSFLPLAAAGAGFDLATRRLRATSQLTVLAGGSQGGPR